MRQLIRQVVRWISCRLYSICWVSPVTIWLCSDRIFCRRNQVLQLPQTYMLKGSFIDDNIVFEMARTGVFEDSKAWDKKTGEPVSLDSCREGYKRAVMEITKCTNLLEKNLLKDMQLSGGTASADAKGHVPDLPQADDEMLLHHETVIDITMLTDIADDPDILDSFFDKGFRLYLTGTGNRRTRVGHCPRRL